MLILEPQIGSTNLSLLFRRNLAGNFRLLATQSPDFALCNEVRFLASTCKAWNQQFPDFSLYFLFAFIVASLYAIDAESRFIGESPDRLLSAKTDKGTLYLRLEIVCTVAN